MFSHCNDIFDLFRYAVSRNRRLAGQTLFSKLNKHHEYDLNPFHPGMC